MGIKQNFADYKASKTTLAWTAVGASALTIAVGFMWGGWVTGGTAQSMAAEAAAHGRTEVVASVCAENFRASDLALAQHEEISSLSGYRQRQFIEGQPWAILPGAEQIGRDAAELCAQMIAAMEVESLSPQVADGVVEAADLEPG